MSGMAQGQVADYNAKVAEINAEAAVREGFAQSGATRDQFAEVKGAQTAALAKSGVDINAGTSATLGLETQRREEVAAAVDIWRGRTEQTKYKNQAEVFRAEAKSARMAGMIGAASSLIGGLSGLGQGSPMSLGQAAPAPVGLPTGTATARVLPPVSATGAVRPRIPVSPMRMNRGML